MMKNSGTTVLQTAVVAIANIVGLSCCTAPTFAQRVLGVDVSYWQGEITQQAWDYAYNSNNRRFAYVRASRGGTTGLGQTSGTPGGGTQETLLRRYDDPRFIQNMVRANAAGFITGPYHFERADLLTNTGTDEADHFIQMAGVYMRPGYLVPMYDFEAGQAERSNQDLAQFSLDFFGTAINLQVSLLGDFSLDGSVDISDYTIWRKGLGTTYTQADYDVWAAHFGETAATGSAVNANAAVPEPTVLFLVATALIGALYRGRIQ